MSLIYHKLNINTINGNTSMLPDFEQYSSNSNCLLIHLREGKNFYNIEGLIPSLVFTKEDGTEVHVENEVQIDNPYRGDLSYIVGPALLEEAIRYTVILLLKDSEENIIASFKFIFNVVKVLRDPHEEENNYEVTITADEKKRISESVLSVNGKLPDENGNVDVEGGSGSVSTVNRIGPDDNGNIALGIGDIPNSVQSVNNHFPDENGNVTVPTGGGGGDVFSVNNVLPDEFGNVELTPDDIPNSVKSVNGNTPDENGNIEIEAGGTVQSINDVLPGADGNVELTVDEIPGSIKSVNGDTPDTSGNVEIESVKVAEQLYSPTGVFDTDIYNYRTTAGSADITSGESKLLLVGGNCDEPVKTQESLTTSEELVSRLEIAIDNEIFIVKVENVVGTYLFTYDGTDWVLNSTVVDIAEYGITITGTPIENDSITVEVTESDGVYSITYTETEVPRITYSITDMDKFKEQFNEIHNTITTTSYEYPVDAIIKYYHDTASDTDAWVLTASIYGQPITVARAPLTTVALQQQYGIVIEGTPELDDKIYITYLMRHYPDLQIAKPTEFVATGINQFDKDTCVFYNHAFDMDGNEIYSTEENKSVIFCKAIGGLETGYICYIEDGSAYSYGYCYKEPKADEPSYDNHIYSHGIKTTRLGNTSVVINEPNKDYYFVVCIDTDAIDRICIHPKWSGIKDTAVEPYRISSITLPTKDIEDNDLPYVSYGLASVRTGSNTFVRDEIDLENFIYHKRLDCQAYDQDVVDYLIANNVPCSYDTHYIFTVLPDAVDIEFNEMDNTYIANDFGTEEYVDSYKVYSKSSYQENLVDKLRRNVLTISAQSLTDDDLRQIYENLHLVMGDDMEY